MTESGNLTGAAISADGNFLAYVSQAGKTYSLRLKNIESEVVVIAPTETRLGSPRFSPDGNFIYRCRGRDIYRTPIFGGDAHKIASNLWSNFSVSLDGRKIAFPSSSSTPSEMSSIVVAETDGGNARQLTALSPDERENSEESPFFLADGQWIYYVFYRAGKGSIRRVSINGGEMFAVSRTDKNVFEPVPSPDGKFLAHAVYNEDAKQPWQVAVQPLENIPEKEKFFDFPAFRLRVRWSADSGLVISVDYTADNYNLWQTDIASGERNPLTNFAADKIYRFDASPDRRFYALSRGDYLYDAVLIER